MAGKSKYQVRHNTRMKCRICGREILLSDYVRFPLADGGYEDWCSNCFETWLDCRLRDIRNSDPMNLAKEKSIEKHIKGE